MTSMKEDNKVVNFKKKFQINIGVVIFGIIFIYLIATIIIYLLAPKISVYEVRQGSILKDTAYTGLAVRDETVVYADEEGYVNYFAEENGKVKVGSMVYTISDEKLIFDSNTSTDKIELTREEERAFVLKIQSFNEQYMEHNYSSTYRFKSELNHSLNKIASHGKTEQLTKILSDNTNSKIKLKTTAIDGVIVYSVDGMEDVSVENVTAKETKKSNYKNNTFVNNELVHAGEPVYKIVRDNNWKLLLSVSDETKQALAEKSSVKVNFKKDNQEIRAQLSFLENQETPIMCLSFNDSMIRYVNDRYLDIELIIEDETGLKIPKSAETTKEFYVVPNEYLTQSENSVLIYRTDENGEVANVICPVTVYYKKDDMIYLEPNDFDENTILAKEESTETYPLKEKAKLKGVYCVNKGYAVFKQINILCESDEYYIIEKGSSYGLSNYDHIVLDGQSVKEEDVVF